MKSQLKRIWWNYGPLVALAAVLIVCVMLLYVLERATCSAKWAEKASFSFYTGCMVDGIPDENVRVLMGE